MERFQKSLALGEALGDKAGMARVLNNIGNIHYSRGDYPQALEYYQNSLTTEEALGNKAGMVGSQNNIGNVYYEQSNYAKALERFQKSLALGEVTGNQEGIANSLGSIGNIYLTQGNYVQALEYFQKSLALSESLGHKAGIAITLDNIGFVYDSQGNYERAMDYLQKSLALREAMGGKEGVARTLRNIGNIHYQQNRYAQALEYFQKSLEIRESLGDKTGIAVSLGSIAKTHEKQGRHAQALDIASRAAALARQVGETEALWRVRLTAGAAYRALNQLPQARMAFEEAINTIETLRADVAGGEQEQQRFFESKVTPYHAMVDLLIAEGHPAEALTFAERAKARVLLDVLQSGRINIVKAMTAGEQEQQRKLSSQLISLNAQVYRETIRPQPDQARLTELKTQLQKARLDFEAFQTNLYAAHPELRAQRGEAAPMRPEEASALPPDAKSAVLEYVVADDKTYLFAIAKAAGKAEAEARVYTVPIKRDGLAKQIEAFREQLAGRDLGFRASAEKLYELLLKPAEAQIAGKVNLVIVPDEKLWELPFQALLTGAHRFLL